MVAHDHRANAAEGGGPAEDGRCLAYWVELGQRLMRANLIRHFLWNWHSIVLVLLTLGLCLVLLCLLQVLLNTLHRLVQRHS